MGGVTTGGAMGGATGGGGATNAGPAKAKAGGGSCSGGLKNGGGCSTTSTTLKLFSIEFCPASNGIDAMASFVPMAWSKASEADTPGLVAPAEISVGLIASPPSEPAVFKPPT